MASILIAEVIDDGTAFGADAAGRIQSALGALSSGGSPIPIGTIEWRTGADSTYGSQTGFAAPLLPAFGQIPLVGEYVILITAPSTANTTSTASEAFYYLGPVNIDGKRNHNISGGIFKRSTQFPVNLPDLPPSFARKTSPYLQPLVGDTIIQDRNGSSIRMSSTQLPTAFGGIGISPDQTSQFTWRSPGSARSNSLPMYQPQAAGNPIMVISVGNPGQASTSISGRLGNFGKSLTMVENVAVDMSCIYITSDQPLQYFLTRNHNNNKQPLNGTNDTGAKPGIPPAGVSKKPEDIANQGNGKGVLYNIDSSPAVNEDNKPKKYTGLMLNPSFGKDFLNGNAYPAPVGAFGGGNAAGAAAANSQILIRSDRIVMDAKYDNIIMSALKDIKIGTRHWRTDFDAVMSLNHELYRQTEMLASHCVELTDKLNKLCGIVKNIQFPTGVGPTGPCLQVYFKDIEKLQEELFDKGKDVQNASATSTAPTAEDNSKFTAGKFASRSAAISTLWWDYEKQRRGAAEIKETEPKKENQGSTGGA